MTLSFSKTRYAANSPLTIRQKGQSGSCFQDEGRERCLCASMINQVMMGGPELFTRYYYHIPSDSYLRLRVCHEEIEPWFLETFPALCGQIMSWASMRCALPNLKDQRKCDRCTTLKVLSKGRVNIPEPSFPWSPTVHFFMAEQVHSSHNIRPISTHSPGRYRWWEMEYAYSNLKPAVIFDMACGE